MYRALLSFRSRRSTWRPVRFVRLVGISPVSMLASSASLPRPDRLPISGGISPPSRLDARTREKSVERLPERGRDAPRQQVVGQVEVLENARKVGELGGDRTGELVLVKIEDLDGLETAKLRRDAA